MGTNNPARITNKVIVKGRLVLQSPLLIGGGDDRTKQNEADIHVMKDADGCPFIPGTSIAGVLRAGWKDEKGHLSASVLFGSTEKNQITEEGSQSMVVVRDILLKGAEVIVRDGVRINTETGTAEAGAKYDYEVVEKDADGDFYMEITVRQQSDHEFPNWKEDVKALIGRLAAGFSLGAMTTKGLGNVVCKSIKMRYFDFSKSDDVKDYLVGGEDATGKNWEVYQKETSEESAEISKTFSIDADFILRTSLLVKGGDPEDYDANAAALRSGDDFVIPGTTIKGVLRHRAERIFKILGKDKHQLDLLMGYSEEKSRQKSRFLVDEVYIHESAIKPYIQTRNKIDRFTGGTMDGALLTEQILYHKGQTEEPYVHMHIKIQNPEEWEMGLALFLLRDLWTGDLPLGGEKSIGRGRLQGKRAVIRSKDEVWELSNNGNISKGDQEILELYAMALSSDLKDEAKSNE